MPWHEHNNRATIWFSLCDLVPSRDSGIRVIILAFGCALVRLRNHNNRATIWFLLHALVPSRDLFNRAIIAAFFCALVQLRNQ